MSDTKSATFEKEPEGRDNRPEAKLLLSNLKKDLPELTELLTRCNGHWGCEDMMYRFYHQSYKVYGLQNLTARIVEKLQALMPDCDLNEWFTSIVKEGTGKEFKMEDNMKWLEITRPIPEGFFHAKYFLEMAVKYGNELEYPPTLAPSGWASLLYLYNIR